MMDESKMDCLPTIEHVIKMEEMYRNANMKFDSKSWNKDQKADFYLGMFAASRVFLSAVRHMQNNPEFKLEQLESETHFRLGEISKIIMDKYQLQGFNT